MNIVAWNVRGINDPLKQKRVVDRVKFIKANFVCMLETRVKENKCQAIFDRHFKGWRMFNNYSYATNGRIWFLWSGQMQVDMIACTDQCITCTISTTLEEFALSAIYGSNEGVERRRLWAHLNSLQGIIANKAWLLTGDFNVIAHPSECSRFDGNQGLSSNIREFTACMQNLAVFDHVYSGPL